MNRLLEGYRAFRAGRWPEEHARYAELSRVGQSPETLIIACSDSRADPTLIFNAGPGEVFVLRNIAALVPPHDAEGTGDGARAAIAYAVLALRVPNILVLGHAQCGGVAAAIDPKAAESIPYVNRWVALANPAVANTHTHDGNAQAERAAVTQSVNRLLDYPFIAARARDGSLQVSGARFDIADGRLEMLDPASGVFRDVT